MISAMDLLDSLIVPLFLLALLVYALLRRYLRGRSLDGVAAPASGEVPKPDEEEEEALPLDYAPCLVYAIRCDNDCERDFVRCAIELAGDFAAVRRYDQGPVEYRYQGEDRLYWPAFTVTHADGAVEHYEFKAAAGLKEEEQRLAARRRRVHWCGEKEREAFKSRAARQCLPLERLQEAGHYVPGGYMAQH